MKTKELVELFLNNPTKKNFEAMKDDTVAMPLIYAKLKDKKNLTKFFDFKEARRIYYFYLIVDKKLSEAALQRMEELATTYEELNEFLSRCDTQKTELVFQKMKALVLPFEEWETAYRNVRKGEGATYKDLANLVFEKMIETAMRFSDWIKAFHDSPDKSKVLALKKMEETAKTFEEWKIFCKYADSEGRKLALQKLGKFKKTFEEWQAIYTDFSAGLTSLAFKKMQSFNNKTFAQWDGVYHTAHKMSSGDELRTMTLRKMWKLAKTFAEWDIIIGRIDGTRKDIALKKMWKLANTFEEWCKIIPLAEGEIKALALQKIKKVKKTRGEWINVYSSKSYADEVKSLASQKIRKNANTFEECLEIYSTGLSELQKLACERVMAINDKNFDEWEEVLEKNRVSWDLRDVLIKKMGELAKDFDDWEFIYRNSNRDLKAKAFKKMAELTGNYYFISERFQFLLEPFFMPKKYYQSFLDSNH